MSDKKPDNPILTNGVTLRDWFAGKVIGQLIANNHKYSDNHYPAEQRAETAYLIADAMLAEREK